MTDQEMKIEMSKPIIVGLNALEWYLLLAFLDYATTKDEMFSSLDDAAAIEKTCKVIHSQVFKDASDVGGKLADILAIKPKKLIVKPDLIV